MREFDDLDRMILGHPAWENRFFEIATTTEIGLDQLRHICPEYYYVTKSFPSILAQLISRRDVDSTTRFYLVGILYSEMGSGIATKGHTDLFRTLCEDINISDEDLALAPQLAETHNLVDGLASLYREGPLLGSLGGQYALEFQADNMLRSFRRAFSVLEGGRTKSSGMEFFIVHDEVEPEHVQAMKQAVLRHMRNDNDLKTIVGGARQVLDLFGQFWAGMSDMIANEPQKKPRRGASLAVVRG